MERKAELAKGLGEPVRELVKAAEGPSLEKGGRIRDVSGTSVYKGVVTG